jgi:hypothetical protein
MEAMALDFHLGQIFNGSRQLDEASVQMGKSRGSNHFRRTMAYGHQIWVNYNISLT